MTAQTTIPCSITPEVAERAGELGIQIEFEQMLEYALHCIPNLRRVTVSVRQPVRAGDEPKIVIDAIVPYRDGEPLNAGDGDWAGWALKTFPAGVWNQVVLLLWDEPADER